MSTMVGKAGLPSSSRLTIAAIRAESEALFRSIGDGAIATDEFGHITRVNPTALSILGLTAEETIGKWFPSVVVALLPDGSPQAVIDRPIVQMFLSGQAISQKMFYRAKDGRSVPVFITVSPIIFRGRPVGAVEVFRDITVESEIDRMKSEFISLASHQLRTPLSTIKTYAHMLDDDYMGRLNADQALALRTIINATNSMNEIIGTLLNIARMESGSIAVNPKRLNTSQIVREIAKSFDVTASNKDVTLRVELPRKALLIKTDGLILREILSNLISNAVKYTTPGGTVVVRLHAQSHHLVFEVTDTGVGIPKDAQSKIFGKFFRAPNVVRQETSGTGLGLYVVKGLVRTLQGKVWFKSEENAGTTFYVSLPQFYRVV